MKKMSYVNAIDVVLNGNEMTDEVRERLEALKASLAKRTATKRTGPTKTQIANAAMAEQIVVAMVAGTAYTIAEIKGLVPELAEANPQKVAPMMSKLIESGRVSREKVKGKSVYTLALV